MSEQTTKGLELYRKAMERKGVTVYKLIKLTGIKKSTIYTYFSGKTALTASVCAVLADAIEEDITEVFPQIKQLRNEVADITEVDYDPNDLTKRTHLPTDEEVTEMETKGLEITIEDMVASASTLVPTDGVTVKSRLIQDLNGTLHEHLSVQPETQVIIYTGIKALNVDLDRTIVHGLKKHVMENECRVHHTAFSMNGEVCISLYVHGKPLMLYRGAEVARLILV